MTCYPEILQSKVLELCKLDSYFQYLSKIPGSYFKYLLFYTFMVFENSSKVSSAFLITTFFYQMYKKKKGTIELHRQDLCKFENRWQSLPTSSITLFFCCSSNWASSRSPWKKNKTNNIHKNFNDFNDCYLEDLNFVANAAQGLPVLVPLLLKVFHLRKDDKIVSEILNCDKTSIKHQTSEVSRLLCSFVRVNCSSCNKHRKKDNYPRIELSIYC